MCSGRRGPAGSMRPQHVRASSELAQLCSLPRQLLLSPLPLPVLLWPPTPQPAQSPRPAAPSLEVCGAPPARRQRRVQSFCAAIARRGPITSVDQVFLSIIVAADLDLRKHFEPPLVQRPPLLPATCAHLGARPGACPPRRGSWSCVGNARRPWDTSSHDHWRLSGNLAHWLREVWRVQAPQRRHRRP